ncbi:MAG: porin family protein [Alphaproteobacteria bacterium]|nr:porin family protein [Alphaproteobacteria bacterium]
MLSWLGRDGGTSGLYVRGEVGYGMGLDANIKDKPPAGTVIACLARGTGCGGELDKIGDSVSFGAGLGYRWNRQLRFDLTADYRPGFAIDDKDQATPFAANYKGDLTSLVGLVNAYWDVPVDLGQYASWLSRVHPWFGVGVGVARNKLDDLSYSQRLASGATATGKLPGASATGLAWQAGLGLGIDILSNLTLDVGYRYLDAGDIKTKAGTVTDSVAGRLAVGEDKGDLKSQEMQMGLRYKL